MGTHVPCMSRLTSDAEMLWIKLGANTYYCYTLLQLWSKASPIIYYMWSIQCIPVHVIVITASPCAQPCLSACIQKETYVFTYMHVYCNFDAGWIGAHTTCTQSWITACQFGTVRASMSTVITWETCINVLSQVCCLFCGTK